MTKEEAIKRIQSWNLDNDKMEVLSAIIPELQESEDERIWRELLNFHKAAANGEVEILPDIRHDIIVTWLEKQGEQMTDKIIERARTEKQRILLTETNGDAHIDWDCCSLQDVKSLLKHGLEYINAQLEKQEEQKSADKVEPKFKVGDWVVSEHSGNTYQIHSIDDSDSNYIRYVCRPLFNNNNDIPCFSEEMIHLWTIQDAKDGDVLATNGGGICVFDSTIEDGKYPFAHCGLTGYGFESYDGKLPFTHDDVHPATKEQRGLLFIEMKEAGYEWDAEKKELRKIDLKKPTWSEEDRIRITNCIQLIGKTGDGEVEWLKSLESRILPQIKPEWSEEDEKHLFGCINYFNGISEISPYYKDFLWLKSLKDQVQSKSIQELNEEVVNEYVDLGLPSGTLWKSFNEEGYYTFDEAIVKFCGGNIPNKEQWEELKNKCKWEWKDAGYEVTGPNGNTIFLSANGYRYGTGVLNVGTCGYYWSSTYHNKDVVYYMGLNIGGICVNNGPRFCGQSVRLVK